MTNIFEKISNVFSRIYNGAHDAVFLDAKEENRESLKRAFNYAAQKHAGQTRRGQQPRPYTDHLLMVWYLSHISGQSIEAQQAALLHDVAEDCLKPGQTAEDAINEIKSLFGETVAEICSKLTIPADMEDTDDAEIEFISSIDGKAKSVKACDNLANLWDAIHDTPVGWDANKIKEVVLFREKIKDIVSKEHTLLHGLFPQIASLAGEPKSPPLHQKRTLQKNIPPFKTP